MDSPAPLERGDEESIESNLRPRDYALDDDMMKNCRLVIGQLR